MRAGDDDRGRDRGRGRGRTRGARRGHPNPYPPNGARSRPDDLDLSHANDGYIWRWDNHRHEWIKYFEADAMAPNASRRAHSPDAYMSGLTPATAMPNVVTRFALKMRSERAMTEAWRKILKQIPDDNPLPAAFPGLQDASLPMNKEHRPAALEYQVPEIKDYAKDYSEMKCPMCAMLCDKTLTMQAADVQKSKRGQSPRTPTAVFATTFQMAAYLTNTPRLKDLLFEITDACHNRDADRLQKALVRPDRPGSHRDRLIALQKELQQYCPSSNEAALQQSLSTLSLAGWLTAKPVILDYLRLIRDWIEDDTPDKMAALKRMEENAIIALGDPTYGSLILPTVLDLSRILALVACKYGNSSAAQLQATGNSIDSQASTKHAKFLEDCANSLREAFIKCLVGGSSGSAAHSVPPDGKRTGIYITSNSCLRLLFQCRKLRNAQQMFVSIDAQSPYLDFYPKAERVTYLYYLGAYHFANNHFYRAQLTLQGAYNLSHRQDFPHRRLILTYLIAANICLGRFPSQTLLSRPEATDIAPHFYPLCRIIAQGDLGTFERHLDVSKETSHWFLRKRILLQLRNRGEVLVWRALIRKTFRYAGFQPEGERMVPFLRLQNVQAAAQFSLSRSQASADRTLTKRGTFSFMTQASTPPAGNGYTDPDLDGVDAAVNETGFDVDSGDYDDAHVGQHQASLLTPPNEEASPTISEIESVFASLIQQGFLRGFLTHGEKPRFAVPGSGPNGGPLVHGFPNVWQVIMAREDDTVPGWVRKDDAPTPTAFAGFEAGGGGRVVNLSGARPAGAGP